MGSAPAPRWDSVPDPAEGSALGLPARDIVPCNPTHGVTLYKRQSLLSLIGTLCEKFFRSFFIQLEIGCADSAPRDIVPCNPIHGVTLYKRQSLLSLNISNSRGAHCAPDEPFLDLVLFGRTLFSPYKFKSSPQVIQ